MSKIFCLTIVFSSFLWAACGSKEEKTDSTAQLLHLNQLYDSALLKKDTSILRSLYAEQFKLVNPDGRLLTKQEQLLNIATSELTWESAESEQVTVDIFGNTAVLLGVFKGRSSYRGNPIAVHERYTTVWIKTDTSWQIVAEQANIIRQ